LTDTEARNGLELAEHIMKVLAAQFGAQQMQREREQREGGEWPGDRRDAPPPRSWRRGRGIVGNGGGTHGACNESRWDCWGRYPVPSCMVRHGRSAPGCRVFSKYEKSRIDKYEKAR